MKNLPGIKFVSFLALLGLVGVGVYAWAQGKTDVRSDHPMFIIKFGWEGKTPDDLDLITYTRKEIKDHIDLHREHPERYKLRSYHFGHADHPERDDGELDKCADAAPKLPSDSSSSTASSVEPSANGSPKGAKTQTAGAVSFASAAEAKAFLDYLDKPPTPTPTPTPTTPKN